MKSKWIIKGYERYRFGEDKKLYRLPYHKNKRSYALREVTKQGNRYCLIDSDGNPSWWYPNREDHRNMVKLDPIPIELINEKDDLPF